MRRVLALLICLLPLLVSGETNRNFQQGSLCFLHVTVIDVVSGVAKPDMTVVIGGDKIIQIGKTADVSAPKDTNKIDATGKFLIPGLWDMHVHWYNLEYNQLFLANGVTGVRQMFGNS